ncbi:MAG: quinone-dependent dihydroorotate dehydrogenase [Pseudobacteriovorax sp.]|nr:quinone-dependent dihydroorotate dehydrogenase [Pseudobacteriovorax sp.]
MTRFLANSEWFGDLGTASLRLLPAEIAHDIGLKLLASKHRRHFVPSVDLSSFSQMSMNVPGIGELHHPIGLAAGFDKNAMAPSGFRSLGLSFLEVGTVTPRPQPGNPKPRMFRYPEQKAIINRMGFNSDGSDKVERQLKNLHWMHSDAPLGVNVGKNKDTTESNAIDDFNRGIEVFHELAKYIVINISSPNTSGLRNLANREFIEALARHNKSLLHKIWFKLDPDMEKQHFQDLIESIGDAGFQGLILSNTHKVSWPEAGGQSGHPIQGLSNRALELAWEVHRGELPTIASGGILSGIDILEKVRRGADAVQIYSALVYRGPFAVLKLLRELEAEMSLQKIAFLSDAKGSYYL